MTIQIDKKALAIGILFLSAVVLIVANLSSTRTAMAGDSIKGREYQVITARVAQGGDGLYLVDNRTGLMAIFTYDTASRSIKPRAVKPVTDAFAGALGGGGKIGKP